MSWFNPMKMSQLRLGIVATVLMVLGCGFIGAALILFPGQVVERSDDGLFRVEVNAGSKWMVAVQTTVFAPGGVTVHHQLPASGGPQGVTLPTPQDLTASVNGTPVSFRTHQGFSMSSSRGNVHTFHDSVMAAEMPADGTLVVDLPDRSLEYVLVKSELLPLFLLAGAAIPLFALSFMCFAFAALRMIVRMFRPAKPQMGS